MAMGVALAALGFVIIFLGWNGAAELDFVSGQLPYVLSAGFTGIGLVGAGLTIAVVQSHRRDTQELLLKLDEIADKVGSAAGASAALLSEVPSEGEMVIAGRSTYHRSSCHLVDGRGDLRPMSPEAAAEQGMTPCRICKPLAA